MKDWLSWNERTVALAIVLLIVALSTYFFYVNYMIDLSGAA